MPVARKRKTAAPKAKKGTVMASTTRTTKRTTKAPKPGRGRPGRKFPPRIDATPEEMAKAMFALPADHEWQFEKDGGKEFRCVDCEKEVNYPDTLYQDGRCEDCHKAQSAPSGGNCSCGIPIARAGICSEPDCPFR